MSNLTVVESQADDMSVEQLEALMAELGGDTAEEVIEASDESEDVIEIAVADEGDVEDDEEISESLLAKAMKAIKKKEVALESYEGQESSDDHVELGEKPVKAAKAPKAPKAAKAPKATKYTHSREELLTLCAKPDFYLLENADLSLDEAGMAKLREEVVNKINTMNVKVGAKCLNLMGAVNGQNKLSTFIESGIRYILSEPEISHADLLAYFMSAARNKVKGYGKGTATPQASTLLCLFTDLKMVKKVGNKYELNQDSTLVAHFKALA